MAFPDYSRPFILDTDASNTGIGAVLSQVLEGGGERVIAYGSRVLSKQERRYCVTRRELLAVVSFLQHFRPYLLGRPFLIRTDHGSLTWLSNFKEPEGQLARWLECLQEFDFTISHRPGQKHQNADCLSRPPCSQCGREDHSTDPGGTVEALEPQVAVILADKSNKEFQQGQRHDGPIGLLLSAVEKGERPTTDEVRGQGPEAQRLAQLWDKLLVEEGVLKRQYEDTQSHSVRLQLVVPHSMRKQVLHELHAGALGGHLGEEKTLLKVKERFYWPGMQGDVQDWCRTCATCATRKTAPTRNRAPLQTIKTGYPMQVVSVDILGPLPESEAGNSYVLVAGDHFTKWMEAYAIPNQEAITVARKLTDEMFCRFSPPEQLHSDQGRQFESDLIKHICKILNVHKTRTSPYHPQCDGLVERFNRTLLHMLATTTREHPFDWEDQIRKVCMAYNTSVQASTGYTPFFLMFGRQARLPIDLMYGTGSHSEMPVSEYAAQLKQSLEDAYRLVRAKLAVSHERRQVQYDKRIHGKPFKEGDLVWLHSTVVPKGQSKKLHHPWTGPLRVVGRLSDSDYRIKALRGQKRVQVVHFDRLKLCVPGTRFPSDPEESPDQAPSEQPVNQSTPGTFGQGMELLDTGPEPAQHRYPRRERHAPDWYAPVISH